MKKLKDNDLYNWVEYHVKQIKKICKKTGNPPEEIITSWYIKKLLL